MRKNAVLLLALLWSVLAYSQSKNTYQEYSYTEFFKLIENEKDSVFKLQDALIKYNPKTDKRFFVEDKMYQVKDTAYPYRNDIVIDKALELNNVQFLIQDTNRGGGNSDIGGLLLDIYFKKKVVLKDVASLHMRYCRFASSFELNSNKCSLSETGLISWDTRITIDYSNFTNFRYQIFCDSDEKYSNFISGNHFEAARKNDVFLMANSDTRSFWFEDNFVKYNRGIFLGSIKTEYTVITNNTFQSDYIQQTTTNVDNQLR